MMHYEEVVVTLVDNNKKPFRELNSQRQDRGRKCDVFAPAAAEYKFLVKNNTDKRIKVDIDIDGTNVSGNGLILNAHQSDYIERFVDSDKKFMTSLLTGEGVADPSCPENGIIKVRVHKEKEIPYSIVKIVEEHHHHHDWDMWNRPWRSVPYWYSSTQPLTYTAKNTNDDIYSSVLRGCASKGILPDANIQAVNCGYNAPAGNVDGATLNAFSASIVPPEQKLATVEGSKSDQIFTTTTWNGDDLMFGEIVFSFYLKLAPTLVDPEYAKYLELKNKFEGK